MALNFPSRGFTPGLWHHRSSPAAAAAATRWRRDPWWRGPPPSSGHGAATPTPTAAAAAASHGAPTASSGRGRDRLHAERAGMPDVQPAAHAIRVEGMIARELPQLLAVLKLPQADRAPTHTRHLSERLNQAPE